MNDNIYIYPTDTVWGIGASIYSEVGNQSVRKIKNKDSNDPLSVLFENKVMLMDYINFPAIIKSENLFKLFNFEISLLLPILWIKKEIPKWVLCDSKYVSIRIVKNNSILKIMKDTNSPITSTSLNFSNEKPITEFIAAKSFCAEVDQEYNLTLLADQDHYYSLSGESSTMITLD
ncbi:MAG: hypothetical protein HOJ35_00215, partial [Bdellovibrionales bacterium]|nr:hypothetical protein [Bdellovibrionales bacterium]